MGINSFSEIKVSVFNPTTNEFYINRKIQKILMLFGEKMKNVISELYLNVLKVWTFPFCFKLEM